MPSERWWAFSTPAEYVEAKETKTFSSAGLDAILKTYWDRFFLKFSFYLYLNIMKTKESGFCKGQQRFCNICIGTANGGEESAW